MSELSTATELDVVADDCIMPIRKGSVAGLWKFSLSALRAFVGSFAAQRTLPDNSLFSWVNQGGASVTVNGNGALYLSAPATSALNVRARVKNVPAAPYVLTAQIVPTLGFGIDFQSCGLCLQESSSGKLILFNFDDESTFSGFIISRWTNPTTVSANAKTQKRTGDRCPVWFRIENDGTNHIYSVSFDGYNFIQLLSEAKAAFCTPDKIGFFAMDQTNVYPCGIAVTSWLEA